ncbi:flagellar FlbD family protein [Fodinisporobacter ferrooxydans]|uniref:Flagellar FlbD family protein n=1 Tax=Fodinisporobacter ferrooxydans TaxID=2901836 RepID=A0ABY4CG74_9BACL|nr:flagellar FlbD family protein [Alicyclobacillaceae bacterium MYW30-H2]
MIRLTRLNGSKMVVNGLFVEMIEATPDTVITLTTGKKIVVKEPVDAVIDAVVQFYRTVGFIKQTVLVKAEGTNTNEE